MVYTKCRLAQLIGFVPEYSCTNFDIFILLSVAVKRIREIMAGADVNSSPPVNPSITQPQRMPVPSPVATPAFNQPLAIFDRQPLPPGVSILCA